MNSKQSKPNNNKLNQNKFNPNELYYKVKTLLIDKFPSKQDEEQYDYEIPEDLKDHPIFNDYLYYKN